MRSPDYVGLRPLELVRRVDRVMFRLVLALLGVGMSAASAPTFVARLPAA